MDYKAIASQAKKHEESMVAFLRDIVAIKSLSGKEKPVIERIKQEVEKLGSADKVWIDGLGNLLVQVGSGPRLIAIDAHIDTVDVGNPNEWKHDPFKGKVDKTHWCGAAARAIKRGPRQRWCMPPKSSKTWA